MKKLNILVVEDGQSQREMLRDFLRKEGHAVAEAESGDRALQRVREGHYDLILLDYKMPGMNGMEVLQAVKGINPEIDVVIITAYGTIETAVDAMKAGALDYITKPVEFEELLLLVERVSERRTLLKENELLREQLGEVGVTTDRIIYRSEKMSALINMAGRVAASRATVLLQGESGTGKELLARLIHQLSPRASRRIIAVNCGALHENLLESELFGYESGSFTGARKEGKRGLFEYANGGTIFLDEIGEMSLPLQARLLRVLQDRKEIRRVGGDKVIPVDVRVIAATNRDLEKEVAEGRFRSDLFWRLNVFPLRVPPLRERRSDIVLLADHFAEKHGRRAGKPILRISSPAIDLFMTYHWPGNVRELENCIERAIILSTDSVIHSYHLPPSLQSADSTGTAPGSTLDAAIARLERELLVESLKMCRGNSAAAARRLGITERRMGLALHRYGIDWRRFRTSM